MSRTVHIVPMLTPQQIAERMRQGWALHQQGRLPDAARAYESVLAASPQHVEALHLLGLVALQSGQPQRGADLIGQALALKPDHAQALINLGYCLQDLRRAPEALAAFDRAIARQFNLADAHLGRGNVLLDLARPQDALESFDRALKHTPKNAIAHHNRANALAALNRHADALASYDKAISLAPTLAPAHAARGGVLLNMAEFEKAARAYEHALSLDPNDAAAWTGWGHALIGLMRHEEALGRFERSCALNPNAADAHLGRATVLSKTGKLDDALEAAERGLALNPALPGAHELRGFIRLDLKQYPGAAADLSRALDEGAKWELALGAYLDACENLCRWDDIEAKLPALTEGISGGKRVCQPFAVQLLSDDAELLLRCASTYAPPAQAPASFPPRTPGAKIRVGYFSSDFNDHPVSHLISGLMAAHDRAHYEVSALSFGKERDVWTQRIESAVDRFIDLRGKSNDEIIAAARAEQLDIAVDLNGFTTGCRPLIFAARVAPLQINYLGFLGTMGAPYMDYIVADDAIVPEDCRRYYAEKVISLAWYQCNEGQVRDANTATRAQHGLPEDAFVFCSFNNSAKLTRVTFQSWMRILQRVPNSVLWLFPKNAPTNVFQDEATRCGVDPARLIFAKRVSLPEHMARFGLADLALDTFPYNGGATGANALEVNVPVLTLTGQSFASRMGASLLKAVGLDPLITTTPQAYEDLAVRLATDSALLAEHRRILAENTRRQLFNIEAFARNIERAYAAAVERHASGLAPDHIDVR